jgi:hypothetical protein
MKFLLAFCLLTAVLSQSIFNIEVIESFKAWKEQHNKAYENSDEQLYRLALFASNYYFVKNFNDETSTVELNLFADLANEEFSSIY